MTRLPNTTSGLLRLKVAPVLLILALCSANTAAFTGPRHVPSLFDLSLEELMEISIGAEWVPDKSGSAPCVLRAVSNDARPSVPRPHDVHLGPVAETNELALAWNK